MCRLCEPGGQRKVKAADSLGQACPTAPSLPLLVSGPPLSTVQPLSSLPLMKIGDLNKTQCWTLARKPMGGGGQDRRLAALPDPSLCPPLPALEAAELPVWCLE